MGLKHRLKRGVREVYARVVFHTGLHRLIDRIEPRRLTILAGHCVRAPSNASLPPDMTIGGEALERILDWLGRRFDVVSVKEGVERLEQGTGRSLVALSMDDGYVDNRTHLLPILQRTGAGATIYLETRPLDERRTNWSHRFFALVARAGLASFVARFTAQSRDARSNELLAALEREGRLTSYHVKRILKYEVPTAERARVIDALTAELGVDDRVLCDTLYMTWDDARALRDAGVDLGGHTVNHEILSGLDAAGNTAEIGGSRAAIERELGAGPVSFAYPFGRRWDWNEASVAAARAAGFAHATTTHAGTNRRGDDPYRLRRVMIDENARLHLLAAEACGAFDLARRFGVDLSD